MVHVLHDVGCYADKCPEGLFFFDFGVWGEVLEVQKLSDYEELLWTVGDSFGKVKLCPKAKRG